MHINFTYGLRKMFEFIQNALNKLLAVEKVAEPLVDPLADAAINILNLAALVRPQHAGAMQNLISVVKKDQVAAKSLVDFTNSKLKTLDKSTIVSLGLDALATAEPQLSPFILLAKPILIGSTSLVDELHSLFTTQVSVSLTPVTSSKTENPKLPETQPHEEEPVLSTHASSSGDE